MKKTLLFLFLALFFLSAQAQKETWKWYFGYTAAMDFVTSPPTILNDCAMYQFEGSSSISDSAGNLLFYTDGTTVWDKNSNIMPNGTGLLGDLSSTQAALIVQYPGSDSLYYIFTTNSGYYFAHYSIVDMSLNGGLGDVGAVKNQILTTNSAEKLKAVKHANGTDYWVVVHQIYNDKFVAFQVSASGISSAYVSSVGITLPNVIGQLQFAPDGSKAAMATYVNPGCTECETIQLVDFDNSTGYFSNAQVITTPHWQTYGLEFSPNGKLLYGGANPGYDQVWQWDLSSGNIDTIIASQLQVGTTLGDAGSLQLAPDGKIYVAQTGSYYVGVINNPDSVGTACDWNAYGVNVSPGQSQLGLPNFVASYFIEEPENPVAIIANTTEVCKKFCVNFTDASSNDPVVWQWTFEGGSPPASDEQNPGDVCYNLAGVYDVTLITTDVNGNSDTLSLPDYITVFETPPFPVITQNGYTLTSSPALAYQWQLNSVDIPGATNQSYDVLQSGYYTVLIFDENGCVNSSGLFVQIVGIDETSHEITLSLFPNPSTGAITIRWNAFADGQNLQIDLLNAIGQLNRTTQVSGSAHETEMDLSDLPAGIYFVQLKTDHVVASQKLCLTR
ncbi:MAG: T9SS type A sorting domain-containing protein [Chitinophagales bacterium]|nr:T9SS type A sorting domain-containing protein [Chitinophagales bacterium]